MFFSASARSYCRWPYRRCSVQFDDFLFEETQAPTSEPFRSWRASQSDQFRLRRPVENPRPRGVGAILALQRRLEPLLDQLLTRASDIVDAGVQRSRDGAVAPPFASVRYVSLQQNARSGQDLRRVLARANHGFEPTALLGAQLHHVLLDRNLLLRHESPPSLASRRQRFRKPTHFQGRGRLAQLLAFGVDRNLAICNRRA